MAMALELGARLSLYDLDGQNTDTLIAAGKLLRPHLDQILDDFYSGALKHPTAAAMFEDPAIMKHARDAQKRHWGHVFDANFGEDYCASAERVGRTHYRIQLPFELYFSAYAKASSNLQAALVKASGRLSNALSPDRLTKLLGVLGRALAMDNDMVIQAYFQAQSEEMPYAFSFIEKGLAGLEHGDLSFEINSTTARDFPAKFENVRQSWNIGVGNLSAAMLAVSNGLHQVKDVSSRLQSATDGLSTRTATQAASIEQTSAAMQQLASTVEHNAENARKADDVSRNARTEVEKSAKVMGETADAMERIQKASEEINKIISMIDDISFQTNLLALNAGVEAARAGEAGRGFAVVASEVRNLAVSSSDAAQQIKKLIQHSTSEVNDGVRLVDEAGTMLKNIVVNFDDVADLASAVANSSAEQSTSLTEVTSAVNQMDQVTQQNAGMAQETSDEVLALVDQIEALNARLVTFRFADNGPTAFDFAA